MPSGACSCKVVDGNEIAASWPRNSLIIHIFARAPAASGKGRGARSAANPSFSFIYAPNPQNIKELEAYFCLSSDYLLQPFRCQIFYANRNQCDADRMHTGWPFLLHTPHPGPLGISNPALIINEFSRGTGSCLRGVYERKIAVRIL